jgi:hypothetical protein
MTYKGVEVETTTRHNEGFMFAGKFIPPSEGKYVHTWLFEFGGEKYGRFIYSDDPQPSKIFYQNARQTIDKLKEKAHA